MALLIPCLLFAGGTQIWAPFFTVGGVLKADSLAIRALTINSAYSFPDAIGSNNTFLGVNGSGVFGFHSPSFSGAGGWTDSGTNVELTTSSDNVGIGGAAHGTIKLNVHGDITMGVSDVLYKGSYRFLHTFRHPTGGTVRPAGENLYLGINAGNFTAGGGTNYVYEGSRNVGIGDFTQSSITDGYYNTSIGAISLRYVTTGNNNMVMGAYTAEYLTTGSNNIAIGSECARFIANGSTYNATSRNSIWMGRGTKASFDGVVNEIAIGHNTTGIGSNSVLLGSGSTINTGLHGNVTIDCDGTFAIGDHNLEIQNGAVYSEIDAGEAQFVTSSDSSMKENKIKLSNKHSQAGILAGFKATPAYEYNWVYDAIYQPFDSTKLNWDNLVTKAVKDSIKKAWHKNQDTRAKKVSGKKCYGLMAQEFGSNFFSKPGAKSIDHNKKTALMWEAIRILINKVESLELRVKELEK